MIMAPVWQYDMLLFAYAEISFIIHTLVKKLIGLTEINPTGVSMFWVRLHCALWDDGDIGDIMLTERQVVKGTVSRKLRHRLLYII